MEGGDECKAILVFDILSAPVNPRTNITAHRRSFAPLRGDRTGVTAKFLYNTLLWAFGEFWDDFFFSIWHYIR